MFHTNNKECPRITLYYRKKANNLYGDILKVRYYNVCPNVRYYNVRPKILSDLIIIFFGNTYWVLLKVSVINFLIVSKKYILTVITQPVTVRVDLIFY